MKQHAVSVATSFVAWRHRDSDQGFHRELRGDAQGGA
jgi:hypothetical protein